MGKFFETCIAIPISTYSLYKAKFYRPPHPAKGRDPTNAGGTDMPGLGTSTMGRADCVTSLVLHYAESVRRELKAGLLRSDFVPEGPHCATAVSSARRMGHRQAE